MVSVIAQKIIFCVGETFTLPPHRHTINSQSNRYTLIYANSSSILLSQVTIHFSCYLSQPEPDPDRPPVSIPLYIRHVASLLGWEHSIRSKYRAIVAQLSPASSTIIAAAAATTNGMACPFFLFCQPSAPKFLLSLLTVDWLYPYCTTSTTSTTTISPMPQHENPFYSSTSQPTTLRWRQKS